VDAGNYVGAAPGGTVLATIMQIAPIQVTASVGEREALRLRAKIAAAGAAAQDGVGRSVAYAQLQGETGRGEAGVLDFVDHQVTQAGGSVGVRARFANADRRLLPGFYARLTLDPGASRRALTVPDAAILSDQQGEFLYVVDKEGVARRRNVRTADLPGRLREVLAGVRERENVVVSGNDRLADGNAVTVADRVEPGDPL
jgi:RND family efflux transporter MFP subunit